jgi:hypothetical protein
MEIERFGRTIQKAKEVETVLKLLLSDLNGNRKRAIRLSAISIIAILLLPVFAPAVDAKTTRGGRTVTVPEVVRINPDNTLNWTTLLNVGNNTDHDLLDYNLTWKPFFQNNTDLKGTTIHTLFSPMLFSINLTNESVSTGSLFRLAPEQIMDGISEVWFRIPVVEIPANASIRTRVYRILTATAFNMTFSNFGNISTSQPGLMQLVYDLTVDPGQSNSSGVFFDVPQNAWEGYKRWLNISVPRSNNTFYYNWTFIKACLGMFPNEWYLTIFDILAPFADGMKLAFTTSDFGNDQQYHSWIWCGGHSYFLPIDLDTSFVATTGVSNGISGIGTSERARAFTENNVFYFNASIPIDQTTINTSKRYFNVLIPLFQNQTIFNQTLLVYVYFYSSIDDSISWHKSYSIHHTMNSTYDFFKASIDLDAHNNSYIDHIRILIQITGNALAPDSNYFKLWGVQKTVNRTTVGYTDLYWVGWNFTSPWTWDIHWKMLERQYFIPFGYYGLDSWYWNITNGPIMTIPINQPTTPTAILDSIQQFEMYLQRRNETDPYTWETVGNWIFKTVWGLVDWGYHTFGKFAADTIEWMWYHFPFLKDFFNAYFAVFEFFKGIGIWLWNVINLIFDALEWFSYWAVRIIYSLSLAIVYMVNIFGVISINSALLNVTKTGNGKDFVRAFSAGWKFILAIIGLLLSLAIMAISIVSAVVPF